MSASQVNDYSYSINPKKFDTNEDAILSEENDDLTVVRVLR